MVIFKKNSRILPFFLTIYNATIFGFKMEIYFDTET